MGSAYGCVSFFISNYFKRLVVVVSVLTPWKLAFIEEDTLAFDVIDFTIDGFFFIDLILNFFMAYFDQNEDIIISRKVCTSMDLQF